MHHLGHVSIAQPIQFEFVTIAKKEYASLASSICNKHTRSLQHRFWGRKSLNTSLVLAIVTLVLHSWIRQCQKSKINHSTYVTILIISDETSPNQTRSQKKNAHNFLSRATRSMASLSINSCNQWICLRTVLHTSAKLIMQCLLPHSPAGIILEVGFHECCNTSADHCEIIAFLHPNYLTLSFN